MMESRLQQQLGAMESMLRRARLRRRLAVCWGAMAVSALLLFLIHGFTGWDTRLVWWIVFIGGLLTAYFIWRREQRRPSDSARSSRSSSRKIRRCGIYFR